MKDNNEIEELLRAKGEKHREIPVPENLETRLHNALEERGVPRKKRQGNWFFKAVAMLLITIIIGYNFNTLAYYGKRIIGYDNIMNTALKELNNLGKGQIIDMSHTFEDGSSVTLDAVMIDENQMLIFYTIKDPKGAAADLNLRADHFVKGLGRRYVAKHGQGEISEDGTEIRWVSSYAPPGFWDRSLSLKFFLQEDGHSEETEMVFKIDREKAMGATLKKSLNIAIKQKETKVQFNTISASPTNTVIEGKLQNTLELLKDHIMGERLRPKAIEFSLIANGEVLRQQAGGMSTNEKGISFRWEFDALPKDLKSLALQIDSVTVDHDVDVSLSIDETTKEKTLEILGQNIVINQLYKEEGATHITISSQEDVLLSRVYLMVDGKRVSLKNTTMEDHIKTESGEIFFTRTLNFPEEGEEYQFIIKSISFMEKYNETIDILID